MALAAGTTTTANAANTSSVPRATTAAGVSKYDVLLVAKEMETGAYELYAAAAKHKEGQQQHVGNNRLMVFCKMHVSAFANASSVAQQEGIVQAVYNIVAQQCIDTECHRAGQFLVLKPRQQQQTKNRPRENNRGAGLAAAVKQEEEEEYGAARKSRGGEGDDYDQEHDEEEDFLDGDKDDLRGYLDTFDDDFDEPEAAADSSSAGEEEEDPLQCIDYRQHWTVLAREQALDFVRDCLEDEQHEASAIAMLPPMPQAMVHSPARASPTRAATTSSVVAVKQQEEEEDTLKRRRRSSLLRRSLSQGNILFTSDYKKKPATQQQSCILQQLQALDVDCSSNCSHGDEGDEGSQGRNVPLDGGDGRGHSGVSTDPTILGEGDAWDGFQPGGGGSSSFGTDVNDAALSRTKKPPPPPLLERSGSWTGSSLQEQHRIVHTANALDVLLQLHSSLTSYVLPPNSHHTGNNRLSVMMTLQMAKYRACRHDAVSVRKMCRDLADAVQTHYQGRFLVVQGGIGTGTNSDDNDDDGGGCCTYLYLNDDQAAAALESIFAATVEAEEDAAAEAAAAATSEDAASNVTRTTQTSTDEQQQQYPRSAVRKQRPSIVKKDTLRQLHELTESVLRDDDAHSSSRSASGSRNFVHDSGDFNNNFLLDNAATKDIHKTAIASLQKRKKRQGVSSKISKMVARNYHQSTETGNLQRSQSVGLPTPPSSSSLSTVPPLPSPLSLVGGVGSGMTRYASTGAKPSEYVSSFNSTNNRVSQAEYLQQQFQQQQQQYQPQLHQQQHDSMQSFQSTVPPNNLQDHEMYVQQQQQPHMPALAQRHQQFVQATVLSEFSQDMIKDMLQRLEVEEQHHQQTNFYSGSGDGSSNYFNNNNNNHGGPML
jgi:hypothetical protein